MLSNSSFCGKTGNSEGRGSYFQGKLIPRRDIFFLREASPNSPLEGNLTQKMFRVVRAWIFEFFRKLEQAVAAPNSAREQNYLPPLPESKIELWVPKSTADTEILQNTE